MRLIGIVEGYGLYAKYDESKNQINYSLDGQEIALYDLKVMKLMEDKIVFKNNTLANELSDTVKDQIQELARTVDVEQLRSDARNYDENAQYRIADALQMDSKKIISLTTIDLDEQVEENETNNEIENKIEDKEEKKEATTKDIQIKQEIQLGRMVTSMKTLGSVLQRAGKMPAMDGKNFTKLGVVESDNIKDIDSNTKTNTTRFSFVAIATDGTVVPIDLEQDYQEGDNPMETTHRINADGSIEQNNVNSRYKIGNNGETLSIKFSNGPGNLEISYSSNKTLGGEGIEGNKSFDHQLQTDSVYFGPKTESLDSEYGHGKYGTENEERNAMIKDKYQTKNKYIEIARKLISEDKDVENVFTEEEIIKMLQHAHNNGIDLDEAVANIREDASRLPSRNK